MSRLSKDNINRHGDQGAKTFRPARVENPVVPKAKTRPDAPVHASPKVTLRDDASRRDGGRIDFD